MSALKRFVLVVAVSLTFTSATPAADEFVSFVAEVTADNLMVRSGPSRNYYVVTKLKAGDRVQVVGEESGWYAIVPPDDCFSLISQDYVDTEVDDRNGVVNGNAVRVRAGSRLERKKYAVQRKLSKGDTVQIVGDDGEGYYKIIPPDGAVLWLHGDFVAAVPKDRMRDRAVADAASSNRNRESKTTAPAPKTQRPKPENRSTKVTEPVEVADSSSGPRPFPPPGAATLPKDGGTGKTAGTVVMKEISPNAIPNSHSNAQPIPVRDWTQNEVQTVAVKPPASRGNSDDAIELVDTPVVERSKPTYESSMSKTKPTSDTGTIELVDSGTDSHGSRTRPGETEKTQQTQYTFDSQKSQDQEVAEAETAPDVIEFQEAPSSASETSVKSFDDQANRTASTFNDEPAVVSIPEPVERPDPYAGIDIQREDGTIKVVIDPIDPGQQLTVDEYRARLMELDAQFKSQLDRPVRQRDYVGMRRHFEELVAQDVDMYSKMYSARRIEQINAMESAALALMKIESQSDTVTAIRQQHMLERSQLQRTAPPIQRGFDAKGELRASLIYSSAAGPRRYRLIDPSLETPRTLCYVEIPGDLEIEIDRYLGQIVGVYARDKYLQTGDVNPIAVLVAEELVALGPGTVAGIGSNERVQVVPIEASPVQSASNNDTFVSPSPAAVPSTAANQFDDRDNGDMIEMQPMEEYTPVVSSEFRSGS